MHTSSTSFTVALVESSTTNDAPVQAQATRTENRCAASSGWSRARRHFAAGGRLVPRHMGLRLDARKCSRHHGGRSRHRGLSVVRLCPSGLGSRSALPPAGLASDPSLGARVQSSAPARSGGFPRGSTGTSHSRLLDRQAFRALAGHGACSVVCIAGGLNLSAGESVPGDRQITIPKRPSQSRSPVVRAEADLLSFDWLSVR